MNTQKSEAFTRFLDQRAADIQKSVVQLNEDHRIDEANFEKIRANIFQQVIKTVFLALQRTPRTEQELRALMDGRLVMFEETWKGSLAKAREHNDEKRILQEEVKLEALKEIRQKFEELWEVPV